MSQPEGSHNIVDEVKEWLNKLHDDIMDKLNESNVVMEEDNAGLNDGNVVVEEGECWIE